MLSQTDFVIALMREEGVLPPNALERATRYAAEHHVGLAEATVALGVVSSRELSIMRAVVSESPFVDLGHYEIDLKNSALLPRSAADRLAAFPLFDLGEVIVVGMADPLDLSAVDRLRSLLKADIETVLCEPAALRALTDRAYSLTGNLAPVDEQHKTQQVKLSGDEPIVAAVNQVIGQALDQGASDIHLGPDEHELHLRYRIDGALQNRQGPPLASHPGLVQRLKVMANLDLTQTRRPQDGKFRFQYGGRNVDLRLSIIPTVCGENVVLRVLSTGAALGDFDDLGVAGELRASFEELLQQPYGMILATGPTGSGKTTTLYTFLKKLNTPERNIVTIEDPVEIRLPLVRQVQVNAEHGISFASALRSILRQDPDVILLGEIRDEETARIAVQAALTGHLVLSTLHTNDAAGAVARLRDFGCPGFAINSAVLCVLAQRLVRRVCQDCAKDYLPDEVLIRRFRIAADRSHFRRGTGCARCMNTGCRGRIGLYELLQMTTQMQTAIENGASTAVIRAEAQRQGMRTLWQDGLAKAQAGFTTLEEVMRVVASSLDGEAGLAPAAARGDMPETGKLQSRAAA